MFKIHLIFDTKYNYSKDYILRVYLGNYSSLYFSFPEEFSKLKDLLFLKRYDCSNVLMGYVGINLKNYDDIPEVLDVVKILYKDFEIFFPPIGNLGANEEEFLKHVKEL